MFTSAGHTAAGAKEKLYSDDVFSTYLHTGNAIDNTNIVNNINLSTYGGAVFVKARSGATARYMSAFDTNRGAAWKLITGTTAAQVADGSMMTFNSNGYGLGHDADTNDTGYTYAGWTFRKAAKFFDVVTYTGNGTTQTVSHNLGVAPGMIIIKSTSLAGTNWAVYHRSLSNGYILRLNETSAQILDSSGNNFGNNSVHVTPTSTQFTVGSAADVNQNTYTYVAYLFAHDTGTDGIIQCGSFTTDGSGNATVNLGWEPQLILAKRSIGGTSNWDMFDTMRGLTVSGTSDARLKVNLSDAETTGSDFFDLTTQGFNCVGQGASSTYIYLAIRRPNKPPTSGTEVYNAIAYAGQANDISLNVGFSPDLALFKNRDAGRAHTFYDKLRGPNRRLDSVDYGAGLAEITAWTDLCKQFTNTGVVLGTDNSTSSCNSSSYRFSSHFFKRAFGIFDVNMFWPYAGGNGYNVPHGLGVAPEMIIVKHTTGGDWTVYHKDLGNDRYVRINTDAAVSISNDWLNYITPNDQYFHMKMGAAWLLSYLFATKRGISKVGSYSGNNTNGRTINCDFTAGARFVLIKRTDAIGNWYIWDSGVGINVGNDYHHAFNISSGEVLSNSIEPESTGFTINQNGTTNINVSGATYIYLAFA